MNRTAFWTILAAFNLLATATAASPTWSAKDLRALEATLACARAPAIKASHLTSLTPPDGHDDLQIGKAMPPQTFRVFGLPVETVYLFRSSPPAAPSSIAIAVFPAEVSWRDLTRAAKLREKRIMGEQTAVRKTALGRLEAWREPPFWIELADPAAAQANKTSVYLSCGMGSDPDEEFAEDPPQPPAATTPAARP